MAHALAREAGDIEICSVDSMQVYRGMDIGTAKPSPAERAEVRYHLLDLAEPDQDFTLAEFQAGMAAALAEIEARGHRALLVGGTALYLRAVVDGLTLPPPYPDVRAELEAEPTPGRSTPAWWRSTRWGPLAWSRPTAGGWFGLSRSRSAAAGPSRPTARASTTHPPTPFRLVGLWLPREVVAARIRARYERQVADGFVDEVRALLARPTGLSRTARQALGYRQLIGHVEDGTALDDAVTAAVNRTTRFARRQRSWFRRDPRIQWVGHPENPLAVLPTLLRDWR